MLNIVHFVSGGASTSRRVWEEQINVRGKLYGLVRTLAVVSDQPQRGGLKNMQSASFSAAHCKEIDPNRDFAEQQLEILDYYQPRLFCQFGLEKRTEPAVLQRYKGINQHLGPGGQYMLGLRRIWTHLEFCKEIGQRLPIPIFCQMVATEFDKGDVVYLEWVDPYEYGQTVEEIADGLLPVEHNVQIEGLRRIALGGYDLQPVPLIARPSEMELLNRLRLDSRKEYPKIH